VFTPATTPGLGTQTDFIKVQASAAFDWRTTPHIRSWAAATKSLRRSSTIATSASSTSTESMCIFSTTYRWRVAIACSRFEPLALHHRRQRSVGAFYLQPTLGGHRDLRGFRESRFRDQNTLLLGAEITAGKPGGALDGAFFVDAGTVRPSRQELSVGNMDVSYGVGFRFHSNSALVGRLDLAFSREGFIPLLRFEHVF
jgi:hypothetical protein